MGSYATLKVGSEELAWKYYVPPILAFLFAEDDFVAVPYEIEVEAAADPYAPPEDPGYDVLGYRTTREGAINNLARKLFGELGERLADKISLYDRVFAVLFEREQDVRDQYARTTARHILRDAPPVSSHENGRALEELMRVIFAAPPGLEVFTTRYSTGDEEIDLIIKNNIDRPFWTALDSPLLFVECKNWSSAVGASELRNFEVKLINHAPLVRVGFFVAPGGFTEGAHTELRRAGRSDYTVVLVEGGALSEYADSGEPTIDWLERLIA